MNTRGDRQRAMLHLSQMRGGGGDARQLDVAVLHAQSTHSKTRRLECASVIDTRDPLIHLPLFLSLQEEVASVRQYQPEGMRMLDNIHQKH